MASQQESPRLPVGDGSACQNYRHDFALLARIGAETGSPCAKGARTRQKPVPAGWARRLGRDGGVHGALAGLGAALETVVLPGISPADEL